MMWPRRLPPWTIAVAVGIALPLSAVQPVGATAGAMKEYAVPGKPIVQGITAAADGALWFTDNLGKVDRITTSGAITEYAVPGKPIVQGITAAADGALWFTDFYTPYVERITTAGKTQRFAFGVSPNIAAEIATGTDGALWITLLDEIHGHGRIGRITTAGGMSMVSVPGTSYLDDITAGPDGELWFTDNLGKVDRITTSGAITEYIVGGEPYHIATGPDGALWFTDHSAFRIGRITTAGHVQYFSLPSHAGYPDAIGSGPDGAVWLTVDGQNAAIYRVTTSGVFTRHALPRPVDYVYPQGIVSGPDGNLWFTVLDYTANLSFIGRITPAGAVTEFATPVTQSAPDGITVGPDQAIWFAGSAGYVGRVATR